MNTYVKLDKVITVVSQQVPRYLFNCMPSLYDIGPYYLHTPGRQFNGIASAAGNDFQDIGPRLGSELFLSCLSENLTQLSSMP